MEYNMIELAKQYGVDVSVIEELSEVDKERFLLGDNYIRNLLLKRTTKHELDYQ